MLKYGDTPAGMAESAMEFIRICQAEGFNQLVVSVITSYSIHYTKLYDPLPEDNEPAVETRSRGNRSGRRRNADVVQIHTAALDRPSRLALRGDEAGCDEKVGEGQIPARNFFAGVIRNNFV